MPGASGGGAINAGYDAVLRRSCFWGNAATHSLEWRVFVTAGTYAEQPVLSEVDREAHPGTFRWRSLLEDSVSQHLSEDALKQNWGRLVDFTAQLSREFPLAAELMRRVLPMLAALFLLSTFAGLLASSYWSHRGQIAREEFERARGLNAQGQHARALRYVRSAAHLEHRNPEYQMALATTLIQLGRFDEAKLQLFGILRKDPTNAEVNLLLARIAAEDGDDGLDEAVQYYQRAIYGLWPANPAENRIRTRFELVDFLASQGRLELLRAELLVLASDLREEPELLERTGFLMLYAEAPENAIGVFQRLLAVAPSDPRAMAGLGKAHLESGNFPAAEQWLQRALRVNPRSSAIQEELALVREVRALDPMARGLSRRARADRAAALLALNYQPLFACATRRILPEEAQQDLSRARDRLEQKRNLQPADEEIESDITLARQLHEQFDLHCEERKEPEALRRLMAVIASR